MGRFGLAVLVLAAVSLLPLSLHRARSMRSAAADQAPNGVRVALCQILCLDGDRAGNRVRIENAVAEAKAAGAELVCFPETAILGWVNPEAHEKAQPIPGEDTEFLSELAKSHGLWICCGLAEKEGERLHDSAVLIDADGEIALHHRKINILSELMTPPYTPGESVEAVETPWGRVGVMICADSFQEELLRRMAARRPALVLIPYGWAAAVDWWPRHGRGLEETVSKAARAIGAPVVGTDLVGQISHGPWRGYVYGGQSLAVDRSGTVLKKLRDRDREIAVVQIDLVPASE